MSPALAGEFFTTSTTWEARSLILWLEVTVIPWWLRWERIRLQWGDLGSIPGLGRSRGGGHGNPLQYSCPENVMDGGAWQATVHGSQRVGHGWVTQHSTSQSPEPADCWEALLQAVVAGGPLSKAGLGRSAVCRPSGQTLCMWVNSDTNLKGGSCLGKALFVAMTAKCKKLHKLWTTQTHFFLPLFAPCLLPSHCPEPITWLGPKLYGTGLQSHMVKSTDVQWRWWRPDANNSLYLHLLTQCACKLTCGWVHTQFMEVLYE